MNIQITIPGKAQEFQMLFCKMYSESYINMSLNDSNSLMKAIFCWVYMYMCVCLVKTQIASFFCRKKWRWEMWIIKYWGWINKAMESWGTPDRKTQGLFFCSPLIGNIHVILSLLLFTCFVLSPCDILLCFL